MSLRDSYYQNSTGLLEQMDAAFTAGGAYVTANLTTLSTALQNSAAQGITKFTVTINGTGTINSGWLRANNGNNLLLKSFFAGITGGLAAQDIYSYNCTLALNVSDQVNTNIDFNFNFQAA